MNARAPPTGLSYTEFVYSDLVVNRNYVSFTLTNSGAVSGAEVPQLCKCCQLIARRDIAAALPSSFHNLTNLLLEGSDRIEFDTAGPLTTSLFVIVWQIFAFQ